MRIFRTNADEAGVWSLTSALKLVGIVTAMGLVMAIHQACDAAEEEVAPRELRDVRDRRDLHLPEPMVFDLVRPLGARQGELEINVLGLGRTRRNVPLRETPGPLGLLPGNGQLAAVEMSPEIEVALWDNFAVEFELPTEDAELAALKPAVQWTFGEVFGGRYIHGLQFIGQYEFNPKLWAPTMLYIGGGRLSPRWSVLGMVGARGEINGEVGSKHAQLLVNLAPFFSLSPALVAGLEANFGQVIDGRSDLLLIPQIHMKFGNSWSLQWGAGARFVKEVVIPQVTFRLIKEWGFCHCR